MATLREAVAAFKNLLGEKQDKDLIRYALTGDGSNAETADVTGKPGWSWVRYDEKQDKASQVLNWQYPGAPQDTPEAIEAARRGAHMYGRSSSP